MNQVQSTLIGILLNSLVSSVILIVISISALISLILMYQEIKKLMVCNTDGKLFLRKKDIVLNSFLIFSVIYISQYLTVNGYENNLLESIVLVSFIALAGMTFSLIIYLSEKFSDKLVERKK